MLWEFWQAWRTPLNLNYVKPLGYLHESIAMRARARRCEPHWQAHYQHCQNGILQALKRAGNCSHLQEKSVLIFGAGHLEDIPLADLAVNFKRVILVDLLFSLQVRRTVSVYSNVQLIEHDVTENLAALFAEPKNTATQLQPPSKWLDRTDIGLVVSLNLITQLPLLPAKYLLKHGWLRLEQTERFSSLLIQQHLDYLHAFRCPVCLIADRQIVEFNHAGVQLDAFNPWWQVAAPSVIEQWDWELAPFGEIQRQTRQVHQVGLSYW
ncbi:hypothetical protein THMIRHAS_11030 [Thiosulfatimonas sediminis]|uniref:Uncharacterized protein n=1 Tax=Thiosulfatimonas sediminis TaxID=2675054 RepID=A0A6F8PUS4_9GAMM|nr:hypothetical protein [Thiosulfatimonas sediminis]BBP45730.1 hypothetical protein THMIRHAS_11030 [Thiosulfatimonas sediminis]